MKEYFGWVQSSDMASVYVHLSGRDVDEAILHLHGLDSEETKTENFIARNCPECKAAILSRQSSRAASSAIHSQTERARARLQR